MNKGQYKVLLFEKDENVGSMLQEFMQMSDIPSNKFSDYNKAYKAFCNDKYDICLISLEKKTENGFNFVEKILNVNHEIILIFIGSHPTLDELTQAYKTGADDFIRKPLILEELYLRILAVIKRTYGVKVGEIAVYKFGKFTFNPRKQLLMINGKSIKVTTKECDLLKYLCDNLNLLVEREAILRDVWKNDSFHNTRSMDVYITKIRQLLRDDQSVAVINVHGKGYKLMTNQ